MQLVKSLYYRYKGLPTWEGRRGTSICLSASIRQGCPLSPLLFVIAVDGIIRRVALESKDTFVRMYADDTAMVMKNLTAELPILANIFTDLQEASHLAFNILK